MTYSSPKGERVLLVPFSARSPESLRAHLREVTAFLSQKPACSIQDLAYTAAVRRAHHPYRACVTGTERAGIEAALIALAEGRSHPHGFEGQGAKRSPLVFLFAGHGTQVNGMGRELYEREPVFRAVIDRADAAFRRLGGRSVTEAILAAADLVQVQIIQPTLFSVSLGLAELWRSWGLVPDAVAGQSMGEVAASVVSGAIDLEEGASIVHHRAELLGRVSGKGAMLMVELSEDEARSHLGPEVAIALLNGPRSTVVSGTPEAIANLAARLREKGVFHRTVSSDIAFHGPQMDVLTGELAARLQALRPKASKISQWSTVTGRIIRGEELDAQYWAQNLRQTVRLRTVVEQLLENGHRSFLEIAPHAVLVPAIEPLLPPEALAVASLRRGVPSAESLAAALAKLYARGHDLAWRALHPEGEHVPLPSYAWQRQSHWLPRSEPKRTRGAALDGPLIGAPFDVALEGQARFWEVPISAEHFPYLRDHRLDGAAIMPASGYIEQALEAGRVVARGNQFVIERVLFRRPLPIDPSAHRVAQLSIVESTGALSFSIASRPHSTREWSVHATGAIRISSEPSPSRPLNGIRARCTRALPLDLHYEMLERTGLFHGDAFRGLEEIWLGEGEAIGRIRTPDALLGDRAVYEIHPAILDAAIQLCVPLVVSDRSPTLLPISVDQVALARRPGRELWCAVRLVERGEQPSFDLRLYDLLGDPIAELRGFRGAFVESRTKVPLIRPEWRREDRSSHEPTRAGRWLILPDAGGAAAILADELVRRGHRAECSSTIERGPWTGVIDLRALDRRGSDARSAIEACHDLLELVRALARSQPKPRLIVVTEGAQPAGDPVRSSLAQAALSGIVRSIPYEIGDLACSSIDLDPADRTRSLAVIADELFTNDELAIRGSERWVHRLFPAKSPDQGTRVAIHSDATYLVSGGLGGFGIAVARWLVSRGARHVALLSRTGASSEERRREISALESMGAKVHAASIDVSDRSSLEAWLAQSKDALPPICGVFHLAGVLADGLITDQGRAELEHVFAPKVEGAWNLHRALSEQRLDCFVLFSSIASVFGSPGQSAYSAANVFLDALAHLRRASGLPALSVDWGTIATGMARDRTAALELRGLGPIAPDAACELLDGILGSNEPQLCAARLDLVRFREAHTAGAGAPRLTTLESPHKKAPKKKSASVLRAVLEASEGDRLHLVEEFLREQVATIIRVESSSVDLDSPLQSFGVDSLTSLELKNRVSAAFELELSSTMMWTYPTIRAMAEFLLSSIGGKVPQNGVHIEQVDRPAAKTNEPIAIVGLACRFPGGAIDLDRFWMNLRSGNDAVGEVPPSRWKVDLLPDDPGARYAALIERIDEFDASFFRISRGEAPRLDPQQRLLLELTWEALEHAGIAPSSLVGSRTGVHIGIASHDYEQLSALDVDRINTYAGTGTHTAFAAGRLSYFFGFEGPSMSIDTVCSSSLVSIHTACRSLATGESDLEVAGGAHLILAPYTSFMMARAQVLAADGRCKTFDARADGTVRGEGGGIVVLKRLSDAVRDGDRVWAVIRGTAVNHDGRSADLTAPNGRAQQALIRSALAAGGVEPSSISYVECHGSGTPLGDPIEVEALSSVYGAPREGADPCRLGAVKTNIGHLEAAAGVAGLIKIVLALNHELIPQNLHFEQKNDLIRLDGTRLEIAAEPRPWRRGQKPRFAAVSSFGMSGTNAHAVLEEPPLEIAPKEAAERMILLPLSAKNPNALRDLARAYRSYLLDQPEDPVRLMQIAHTAGARRDHLDHRLAILGSTRSELLEALEAYLDGSQHPRWIAGQASSAFRPIFCVPGLVPPRSELIDRLAQEEHAFRDLFSEYARAMGSRPGGGGFAFAAATARLFTSWGTGPKAVIGHGAGEIAAAYIAGVIDLSEASRLLDSGPSSGAIAQLIERKGAPRGALAFYAASHEGEVNEIASRIGEHAVVAEIAPNGIPWEDARSSLLRSLASFYVRGAAIDWKLVAPRVGAPIELPKYPWQRQRFWFEQREQPKEAPKALMKDQG
jgi:acyl transferase domain-containing protein/NAD(P)-dependent dehydrogenase (short-subunit alcohol dehydrogenase family)